MRELSHSAASNRCSILLLSGFGNDSIHLHFALMSIQLKGTGREDKLWFWLLVECANASGTVQCAWAAVLDSTGERQLVLENETNVTTSFSLDFSEGAL